MQNSMSNKLQKQVFHYLQPTRRISVVRDVMVSRRYVVRDPSWRCDLKDVFEVFGHLGIYVIFFLFPTIFFLLCCIDLSF